MTYFITDKFLNKKSTPMDEQAIASAVWYEMEWLISDISRQSLRRCHSKLTLMDVWYSCLLLTN